MHIDFATVKKLHQSGDLDTAKTGYLQLLKKNPNDIEALHYLSILCAQQDNISDAIIYLEKAIQLKPNELVFQLHLANLFKAQGSFKKAEKTLLDLIAVDHNCPPAYNNLATVYYAQANFPRAIDCYRQAIALQPDYIDAYYNLGLTLNKHNDLLESLATFKKLIDIAPHHGPAQFQIGCILMQQGKFAEAVTTLASLEQLHPHHFETQTNLATCYLQTGDLERAKQHYLKALELSPQDTQILYNVGVIDMQLGQVDSAIRHYQQVLRIHPQLFEAHNNLAIAYLAKNHVSFALDHFKEALQLQPHNAAIAHVIQMLNKDQRLTASPPEYLRNLFDAYADHYDAHLLTALDYHVPELLRDAVLNVSALREKSLDILDLGCGTGLCGVTFKPYAKSLTGIDISEKMLAIARGKNCYDHLYTDMLENFLTDTQSCYDLILAGDVLVYTGALKILFSLAHQALRPQGLFVFNAEITEEKSFVINQSGRFAHQREYIDALAKEFHFKIISYQQAATRNQNNEAVVGHVYVLQNYKI